jgi:hypothetical protein
MDLVRLTDTPKAKTRRTSPSRWLAWGVCGSPGTLAGVPIEWASWITVHTIDSAAHHTTTRRTKVHRFLDSSVGPACASI